MLRRLGVTLLLLATANVFAGEMIEVDVHGMTCAFCVDAVQRNLGKLPDVKTVQVSLESSKVRIESSEDHLDVDRVKQTILDSGFTPVSVQVVGETQGRAR
jgi:copper chaperone CopZ